MHLIFTITLISRQLCPQFFSDEETKVSSRAGILTFSCVCIYPQLCSYLAVNLPALNQQHNSHGSGIQEKPRALYREYLPKSVTFQGKEDQKQICPINLTCCNSLTYYIPNTWSIPNVYPGNTSDRIQPVNYRFLQYSGCHITGTQYLSNESKNEHIRHNSSHNIQI